MDGLKKTEGWGNGKPSVSVIIPTYNEAKNLPLILPYIPRDVVDEVIVVDGRSRDYTAEIARQLMPDLRVVMETRPGKGAAMKRGYREATSDILVVMDADGSNDPREIPRFVNALMEGADFVKGSRFAPTGGTTDMPRFRKMGNWGFVVLSNALFSTRFTDFAYGYHAFWRHVLDYLDMEKVNGFEIDASIYLQAVRKKLKVVEVPSFEGFRFYGEGKLKTLPDGWRVLKTIMREWRQGVRHRAPEPQVGFRSYGVNPVLKQTDIVPVTGPEAAEGVREAQHSNGQPHSFSISELFQQKLRTDSPEDLQTLLPAAMVSAMETLGTSSGGVVLFDGELNITHSYRAFGRTIMEIEPDELTETIEKGIIGWVIQHRQPAVLKSTFDDPRWYNMEWEEQQAVTRTALVVPFFEEAQLSGVLTLTRPVDRPFTKKDLHELMDLQVKI